MKLLIFVLLAAFLVYVHCYPAINEEVRVTPVHAEAVEASDTHIRQKRHGFGRGGYGGFPGGFGGYPGGFGGYPGGYGGYPGGYGGFYPGGYGGFPGGFGGGYSGSSAQASSYSGGFFG